MEITLSVIAQQLRTMADNLEGCDARGGDWTSMIDVNEGRSRHQHWVTAEDVLRALDELSGGTDARIREMAESFPAVVVS